MLSRRTRVRAAAEETLFLARERDKAYGRVELDLRHVELQGQDLDGLHTFLAAMARAMASSCVVPLPSSSAPGARVEPQDPRES